MTPPILRLPDEILIQILQDFLVQPSTPEASPGRILIFARGDRRESIEAAKGKRPWTPHVDLLFVCRRFSLVGADLIYSRAVLRMQGSRALAEFVQRARHSSLAAVRSVEVVVEVRIEKDAGGGDEGFYVWHLLGPMTSYDGVEELRLVRGEGDGLGCLFESLPFPGLQKLVIRVCRCASSGSPPDVWVVAQGLRMAIAKMLPYFFAGTPGRVPLTWYGAKGYDGDIPGMKGRKAKPRTSSGRIDEKALQALRLEQ